MQWFQEEAIFPVKLHLIKLNKAQPIQLEISKIVHYVLSSSCRDFYLVFLAKTTMFFPIKNLKPSLSRRRLTGKIYLSYSFSALD